MFERLLEWPSTDPHHAALFNIAAGLLWASFAAFAGIRKREWMGIRFSEHPRRYWTVVFAMTGIAVVLVGDGIIGLLR